LVIQLFGGVRATARVVKRAPQSVSKWRASRASKGTNGDIPSGEVQRLLLEEAEKRGIELTSDDLIWGR
jgi:hypothetical protein